MFITRTLNQGGAERQLVTLAKGLQSRGHKVVVVSLYSGGHLQTELESSDVSVSVLNKKGRWDIFLFLIKLMTYLRSQDPDILHGYHVVPNILVAICKPFMRKAKIIWGVRSSNVDLKKYDWTARLTFNASCMLSRFADAIIVNSTRGLEYHHSRGYPLNKMAVIHNGIDTEKFKPDVNERNRVRNEWKVPQNVKLIGIVARLDPMKDHTTFLSAAKLILKKRSNIRFACVGSGHEEYKRTLINLCNDLGISQHVIFVEERLDMPAVYNALDILTSCSISEGFSNVICEAMSCGIPCVVTDAGDSSTIVGQRGNVITIGDVNALAETWYTELEKPASAPAVELREYIENSFSVKCLINNTENKLETVMV